MTRSPMLRDVVGERARNIAFQIRRLLDEVDALGDEPEDDDALVRKLDGLAWWIGLAGR